MFLGCAALLGMTLLTADPSPERVPRPAPTDSDSEPAWVPGTHPKSVYRVSWIADGATLAASSAAVAIPYALSARLIHPRCPCDPSEVNALDRPVIGNHSEVTDVLSDVTVGLAIAVPIGLDVWDLGLSPELLEDLIVGTETLTVDGALVTAAKYTVQRPLPRTYAGDPTLINSPGGYRSFYSGHTAITVGALTMAAMTYGLRHGLSAWPWVIVGAVGLSVAWERVEAGRHFYTDVAVGAVAGLAVGLIIPELHARRVPGRIAIIPNPGGAGLAWISPW